MINLEAATSAAGAVAHLQGSNITNALPMVTQMVQTKTQVIGVYDLIYPYLHINYPTRDEIDLLIKTTLLTHHSTNWHLPIAAITPSPGSPIGLPGTTSTQPVPLIPKEKVLEDGTLVRAGSPVNAIGYGI